MLTSEEVHEVSRDVAVGTNDTALTRWSRRPGGTRGALNRSYIRPQRTFNHILLQQTLIWRRVVKDLWSTKLIYTAFIIVARCDSNFMAETQKASWEL